MKVTTMSGLAGQRTATIGAGALLAFAAFMSAPAAAQTTAAPRLEKPDADSPKTSPTMPSTGQDLSHKLDRSNGVIKPPAGVDPGMPVHKGDEAAHGTMPVIPPPGSPGGDQRVQPK
jgi:hypothetical protein